MPFSPCSFQEHGKRCLKRIKFSMLHPSMAAYIDRLLPHPSSSHSSLLLLSPVKIANKGRIFVRPSASSSLLASPIDSGPIDANLEV